MKSLATILAVLVIQIVDAVEEEGDVNIIIKQNVVLPDVDECLEKIDACAENELCINMPGTYRCACVDGFEKVKGICKDVDECSENIDTCNDTNEVCVNSVGSFSCVCSDGFEKLEDICEDIDECIEKCRIHGECANNPGSFTCTCNEGFEEVEGICEDIDECKDDTNNPCGANEVCANHPLGNYTCTCEQGYTRVEDSCDKCKAPSAYHDELGCITLVSDKYWAGAKEGCLSEGKRLIEGIKKVHLDFLVTHFGTPSEGYAWIGMLYNRWNTSNEEVPQDDEIWGGSPPPTELKHWGVVDLKNVPPRLAHKDNYWEFTSLCQSLP